MISLVGRTVSRAMLAALSLLCAGATLAQSVTLVPGQSKFAGTGTAGFNGDFNQAGSLQLNGPTGLATDIRGDIFVTDKNNNCVRRIDTAGSETITAGLVTAGANDTCNTASNPTPTTAQGLLGPAGVAVSVSGDVYIADSGHNCVRFLAGGSNSGTSNLTQVAGTCGAPTLVSATPSPAGLALDSTGNLYIAIRDTTDGIYQIVRHAPGAAATNLCLLAGAPSALVPLQCPGYTASSATLNQPGAVAISQSGDIYFSDTANNCIRALVSGTLTTAVGTCGSTTSAIQNPRGLVFSLAGNLFFVTSSPARYYRFMLNTGALLQVAGLPDGSTGPYNSAQDGAAASTVPLNDPVGITVDASNNTYVTDSGNSIIRRFSFGNIFPATPDGSSSNPNLLTFQINTSSSLAISLGADYTILQNTCNGAQTANAAGTVPNYCSVGVVFSPTRPGARNSPITVTDSLSNSVVTAGLQGTGVGGQGLLFQGVAGTLANNLSNGIDAAVTSAGDAYVLEQGSGGNGDIRKFPAAGGASSTVVITSALANPTALAVDAAGNWYVADAGTGSIQRYSAVTGTQANYIPNVDTPSSLAVDGYGNALIGENGTRKDVIRVYSGGVRVLLAGGGTATPSEGVPATSVAFQSVTAVAQTASGTVYIGDSLAHRVYGIDSTGTLHLLAGNGTSTNTVGGTALGQGLGNVQDLAVDAAGDVLITDAGNNKVLLITNSSSSTMNLTRIFGLQSGAAGYTGDGGLSNVASLNGPQSARVGPDGTIFVVDRNNNALRTIRFPNYPPLPLLDFGTPAVGSVTTLTQTLFNDGNTALLRTTDPVISNPAFTNNSTQTTCGQSVAVGSLCTFGFTFSPTSPGVQTGTATINDSDLHSPQVVGLTGGAVPATVTSFTAPTETEVYGQPYTGTVTLTTNGGTVPQGTITFSVNGGTSVCTVTGTFSGTVTCTLPAGTGLGVSGGPYPVTITFTGNYPTQTTTTTLTITPAPITELVNNKTKVYLAANPTLDGTTNGLTTQSGSIVNGVGTDRFLINYSTTATQTSTPGTYPITATVTPQGTTDPANYTVKNTPGTLTITTASIGGFPGTGTGGTGGTGTGGTGTGGTGTGGTGTGGTGTGGSGGTGTGTGAGPETEVYGGVYTGTVTYSTGGGVAPTGTFTFSVNGTVVCTTPVTGPTSTTCTNPAGSGLAVGTYPVVVTYSGDSNYAPGTSTTTLTVTKAPLTVTVDSKTKAYGAAVPVLTGTASGLVNGDTIGTAITTTYATTVTATTPVGTYPGSITVTVGGTSAANYTITTVPGNFTVTAVATTLRLTTSASPVQIGTAVTFTAVVAATGSTAIPTGNVVFTSDGVVLGTGTLDATGTATLTTSTLSAGTHAIVATYAGNSNFGPSSGSLTEVVTLPVGSFVVTATPQTQLIRGAGQTVYNVLVTSLNGFSGPVALTCAGLPADATCSFAQATVTLTANGTATTTMTTTTTLADATARLAPMEKLFPSLTPRSGATGTGDMLVSAAAMLPMQLGGLGLFASGLRRRKKLGSRFHLLLLLALSIMVMGLTGCGCPSTAYHAYPITITGTSVLGGPAPSSAVVYLYVALPTYGN